MSVVYANIGDVKYILRIGGKEEVRKHLGKLGFVPGSKVLVVAKTRENVILNVKNVRVAINKELAMKIFV